MMTPTLPSLLASHGTFGLNLDIFETNIINLAIVIAGLTWFLRGFLGGILERRRERILGELKDAEERLSVATASLAVAQNSLGEARARAEQIRAEGKVRAEAIRLENEKRTVEEMARLKQDSKSDMDSEVSRVSKLLQREAAEMAIAKALASLPGRLDASTQAQLIDQSIQSMGNA
ncbi:F0F1 ATP synthase subunit B [Cyanobium sp. N5-Cardenillas]|uniref:F0F1 ATP synthase subunit B n=1 Tax=Cyanobium sp. N5-Cardenillas TaxID=2823720 RepID=UPI0020CD8A54|nr:F0F1 ATP synthase subunit B [Cyanobium sp. N5-Cardenillas]MCP9787294.1 F0F1 ATP synthase subunit B [Cyanobium sp. N5-Cardenillas]